MTIAHGEAPAASPAPLPLPLRFLRRMEDGALVVALLFATLLPLIDALGRPLGGFYVPGSALYVQQLTLWLAFVGGLLATRENQHLTLSTSELLGDGRLRRISRLIAFSVAGVVLGVLAYASVELVQANRQQGKLLPGGVPQWLLECIMPLALAIMSLRFAWGASRSWRGRSVALVLVAASLALVYQVERGQEGALLLERLQPFIWPLALTIVGAALFGAPVFVAMGGLALLMFFKDQTPVSAVSAEVYRLIASPTLPAIPLLTAAGYILAEGQASTRLVRFFQALFGWMPGGMAVMVAGVCAVFTTFTGGSGVTIIALGGLVLPMLMRARYPEGFSLGLVTASGSLGLLFPPSLPVILYAIVAGVPADSLYLAGLPPGLLLVLIVAAYGIHVGRRVSEGRQAFAGRELLLAFWGAKWELALPTLVIVLFASGKASIVEASAAACAFAVLIVCVIMKDLRWRELPAVLVKAGALLGAVLILLSVAMGLTSYLVDAQIPDQLLQWVKAHIHSQVAFLLVLNLILLVLGSVLEIYSAIIILVPLVTPMGLAYGVDPVHLGVIFLANLELGFLFPPVGLNLLLSSARFGKPLGELYRHVVPFLIILGLGVLLITYWPDLSLGILKLLGRYEAPAAALAVP